MGAEVRVQREASAISRGAGAHTCWRAAPGLLGKERTELVQNANGQCTCTCTCQMSVSPWVRYHDSRRVTSLPALDDRWPHATSGPGRGLNPDRNIARLDQGRGS